MDSPSRGRISFHEGTLCVGMASEPFDGDMETGDTCSDDDDIVHSERGGVFWERGIKKVQWNREESVR
jgi:hypothetical protein